MQYILMTILVSGIVILDQITKLLVVKSIPLWGRVPFIDGLVHWTYAQNTGAAWSSFEGMIWLFALIFLIFTVLAALEFRRNRLGFTAFEKWCVAAVWAGGLGNMIDRLRLGYVVDMIAVEFIDFPVFNVADCFITCGCVGLMIHLIFFNKAFWKDEKA